MAVMSLMVFVSKGSMNQQVYRRILRGLFKLSGLDERGQGQRGPDLRQALEVLLDAVGVQRDAKPRRLARRRQDSRAQLIVRRLGVAQLPDDDADGDGDAEESRDDGVGHLAFVAFDSRVSRKVTVKRYGNS